MNLSYRASAPFNTDIVDSAEGVVLYQTETDKAARPTTRVKKLIPGTEDVKVLAEIHWATLKSHADILYRGEKLQMSDLLQKQGHSSKLYVYYLGGTFLPLIHILNFPSGHERSLRGTGNNTNGKSTLH